MGRMRTLKPEAATSESLATVPREVRWTFAMLWTYLDDDGRGLNNARLIKAAIYPLDDDMTAEAIAADIRTLVAAENLCLYVVDGKEYIHAPSFHEHQHPNRKVPSKLPPCPGIDGDKHVSPTPVEPSLPTHTQRSEPSVSTQPQLTPVVVVEGRVDVEGDVDGDGGELAIAPRPPRKPRPPDLLWDALVAACKLESSQMTDTARGSANRARRELAAVGATPEQVRSRAEDYRRKFPTAALTPAALVKHWPQLTAQPQQRYNPDGTAVGEGKPW